jgi:tRNA(fMet)-specific endonuclease VapC
MWNSGNLKMSKYLLDTTVLIEHLRGRQQVVDLITGLAQADNELGVCPINVAELYSGLNERYRNIAEKLVNSLECWEASKDIAITAGSYRYEFASKGVTLTTADAMVAAIAVAQGAVLITANAKHYPMTDIKILRQP